MNAWLFLMVRLGPEPTDHKLGFVAPVVFEHIPVPLAGEEFQIWLPGRDPLLFGQVTERVFAIESRDGEFQPPKAFTLHVQASLFPGDEVDGWSAARFRNLIRRFVDAGMELSKENTCIPLAARAALDSFPSSQFEP